MKNLTLLAGAAIFCALPLYAQQGNSRSLSNAQDTSAMEQRIKDLEERIIALEGQVRLLKSVQAAQAPAQPAAAPAEATVTAAAPLPSPAPQVVPTTAGSLPVYGGAGGSAAKAPKSHIHGSGDFFRQAGRKSLPASSPP